MIEAHQQHEIYLEAKAELKTLELYSANFLQWYQAGLRSGDAPFVFYSGFVLGIGLLYKIAKQAMSHRDGLKLYALLLPALGVFKITGKHNLSLQAFLSLAKFLSAPEEVAKALMANITVSYTGRPFHALGADELLEMLQGYVKRATGEAWDPSKAFVHTSLNFFLGAVRENVGHATDGKGGEKDAKGQHVAAAHADTSLLADRARDFSLFSFDVAQPRKSLTDISATNSYGERLFPRSFEPVEAYIHADVGGLMDWTRPFTPTSPVFAAASAGAQDYLERGGTLGDADITPIEQDAAQDAAPEGAQVRDCGVCAQRTGDGACVCVDCSVTCCARCAVHRPGQEEAGRVCAACAMPDGGDAEEATARAEALAFGDEAAVARDLLSA